ncbi:MAG: MarR family transcriptional regulator [Nanoarchaeota archaeon]|nr:MarR family transcriptional regulator [Nanoarchaeota archaeon]MBU1622573.1 MarR family transcriptional regulator [Nanoarchaeota archaeon]
MKNKHVGFLIIGIALLFFFVVMSYNNAIKTIIDTTCTHGTSCPMQITLRTQEIISYSLMGLLVVVGLFISFLMKEDLRLHKKETKLSKEELNSKIENLDEEEKKIMQIVLREDGSIYQSDLIKETKLSKVKVSRLLDRLEGKGLIERKRRGMTNVIILK